MVARRVRKVVGGALIGHGLLLVLDEDLKLLGGELPFLEEADFQLESEAEPVSAGELHVLGAAAHIHQPIDLHGLSGHFNGEKLRVLEDCHQFELDEQFLLGLLAVEAELIRLSGRIQYGSRVHPRPRDGRRRSEDRAGLLLSFFGCLRRFFAAVGFLHLFDVHDVVVGRVKSRTFLAV